MSKTATRKASGMSRQDVLVRKLRKVLVPSGRRKANGQDPRALAFQAEVMRLGFIMDDTLVAHVSKLSDRQIEVLYEEVTGILSNLVGSDVDYVPFYPNFPQQVLDASDIELFLNAILHYWTMGTWRPNYAKETRLPAFEATKFKTLSLGASDDILSVFTSILGTNASTSDYDKRVVTFVMDNYTESELVMALPEQIPFKEQLCAFVGDCISRDLGALGMNALKTATDILRVATNMSGGDITLAENTKFKSFKRSLRRQLVNRLNDVINEDDIARHRTKWVALAHSLHVGEYAKSAPKAARILKMARDGSHKFRSFDSKVEAAIASKDVNAIVDLLKTRPGNFARRLDHIMRSFSKQKAKTVAQAFVDVADKVDTRVLLQLYGHFKIRTDEVNKRLVFPKGKTAKGVLLRDTLPAQGKLATRTLMTGIARTLQDRFCELDEMGSVYIDPALMDCPIPLSLRSASDGLETVARGTKIPLTDKQTLRMFIYWVGQDIDLSAQAFSADFSEAFQISYTNLREGAINSCHSGDITRAPKGAAEFIDIDMESARRVGVRYIVMNVYVYSGPTFAEHKKCYVGWMTRNHPNRNEAYDPKTVEQKIDLTSDSRTAIPVIFDIEERKAIWLDMVTANRGIGGIRNYINSVETNRATTFDVLEGAMSLDNKPTLYDLFRFHAEARGKLVDNIDDADMVISWDGDVKPTDTNVILSEYL